MIRFIKLNKKFNSKEVLSNCSFELEDKGLYIFKADNGSGKTTFGKIFSGEISFEGNIKIDDEIFSNKNRKKLTEKVFYVDQKNNYVTYLNEGENRALSKELISNAKKPFENVNNKKVNVLSDGEKSIMVLDNVFNSNKSIIIFDEVTAFLDDKNYSLFINKLIKLAKEKLVIFITHDDRVDINKFNYLTIINKKIVVKNLNESETNLTNNSAKSTLKRNKNTIFYIFRKLFLSNWIINVPSTILLTFSLILFTNFINIYFYDFDGALRSLYQEEKKDFDIEIKSFDLDEVNQSIFSKEDANYLLSFNKEYLTFFNKNFELTFTDEKKIFLNEATLNKYEHTSTTVIYPCLGNFYELSYEITSDTLPKLSIEYLETITPLKPEIVFGFDNSNEEDIYKVGYSKKVMSITQFNSLYNTNYEYSLDDSVVISSKLNISNKLQFLKPKKSKNNEMTFGELFLNINPNLINNNDISNLLDVNEVVVSDKVFQKIFENKVPFNSVLIKLYKDNPNTINTLIKIFSTRQFSLGYINGSYELHSKLITLNDLISTFNVNSLFIYVLIFSLSLFYVVIFIVYSYIFNKKEKSNFNVLLNSGMTRKEVTLLTLSNIGVSTFISLLLGLAFASFDFSSLGMAFKEFGCIPTIYFYSYKTLLIYLLIFILSLGLAYLILKMINRSKE